MKVQKKRRLKGKTNYSNRLVLLKSDIPRIVVRRTNKYINIQYVESHESKDKVLMSFSSKELLKNGWPEGKKGSLKSIPACYLTGFLAGKKFSKENKEVILDLGLQRSISGGRLFSVLKGLVDSGLNIKHSEKVFPNQERVEGKHLKSDIGAEISKIMEKIKNA